MVESDVSGYDPLVAIDVDTPLPSSQEGSYEIEDLVDMPETDVVERLHTVETAQAVQTAVQSGAEATQAAVQAGAASTNAAVHAGTWSTMLAGSAGLVAGIFIGLAINRK